MAPANIATVLLFEEELLDLAGEGIGVETGGGEEEGGGEGKVVFASLATPPDDDGDGEREGEREDPGDTPAARTFEVGGGGGFT